MEDLWRVQGSGIDVNELADSAQFRRLIARFRVNEEQVNRRKLLYQAKTSDNSVTGESK